MTLVSLEHHLYREEEALKRYMDQHVLLQQHCHWRLM